MTKYLRLVLFGLLFSSVAYSKPPKPPKLWAFGLGGSAVYQQPRYVDTDFTGIDNFSYQTKLQWRAALNVRMIPDDRYYIGLSLGMRDAGWRKVNDDPSIEPYWTKTDYSFLYALVDFSVGTGFSKNIPLFNPTVGFTQHFGFSTREITYFEDGHTERTDSFVYPNTYPNSIYLAFNYAWNVNSHSEIGLQYRCEFGIKKYHDVIVRSPQIQHGIGINYQFSL
jgi:hypothetical protein